MILALFKSYYALKNKVTIGTFVNLDKSNIFNKDGTLKKRNAIPVAINWLSNIAHIFLFTYAFKFAKMGGMNQGVVMTVLAFAMVFNTITFYYSFGESVSCIKVVGMVFIFSCIVLLGFDAGSRTETESGEKKE